MILIYGEKTDMILELLTAARLLASTLGLELGVLVINDDLQAKELAAMGANTCLVRNAAFSPADTALVAGVLYQAVRNLNASIILLASDRRGKELAGRLAQKLDAGCLTDVTGLQVMNGRVQCARNALGGATVVTQQIESEYQVIAIAPRSFAAAAAQEGGMAQDLDLEVEASPVKLIASHKKSGDAAEIEAADILVIVGQGMEEADMDLARDIAAALGGELACSKPIATDRKWLGEDRIIGLSGKKCKPQLAIILGVSGQVQFTVGIRDAHTIVAVNNDEQAFILQMADYAMVADLTEVLPQLQALL
ncbi:MAG: electron transfer flavoprotein subunit alpha/FixB family protein [Syntrophomonadaceae bacterium]|nr:electron transfer flavoprotein subunit alpha/FixB family protein [Syntrophomonadaceae bacterium]